MWCADLLQNFLTFAIHESDTELDKLRKKLSVMYYALVLTSGLVLLHSSGLYGSQLAAYFQTAVTLTWWAHLWASKRLPLSMIEGYNALLCLEIAVLDCMAAASASERAWPLFVIPIDILLLCRVRTWPCCIAVAAWLGVACLEGALRFGMYDVLPGWMASSTEEIKETVACGNPPCPSTNKSLLSGLKYMTFLVDYLITRRFASGMEEQNTKLELSFETSRRVASHLAMLDLEEAQKCLDGTAASLPRTLHEAFQSIVGNLESFKEFLPRSCLPFAEEEIVAINESTETPHDTPPSPSACSSAAPALLRRRNITVAVANMKATHAALGDLSGCGDAALEAFASAHTAVLASALHCFSRGVVDSFAGDRIYIVFNASRACGLHAEAAVSGAETFTEAGALRVTVNVGIATGRAACGDLGCTGLKRFSVVGPVASWAPAVERLGSEWGVRILIDTPTKEDVAFFHACQLRLQAVAFRCRSAAYLWGVLGRVQKGPAHMEWMYELSSPSLWDKYNTAAKAYLAGDVEAATAACEEMLESSSTAVVAASPASDEEEEEAIFAGTSPRSEKDDDEDACSHPALDAMRSLYWKLRTSTPPPQVYCVLW